MSEESIVGKRSTGTMWLFPELPNIPEEAYEYLVEKLKEQGVIK